MNKYPDYKNYIVKKIAENSGVKSYRTLLAAAAGCERSYFSRVVNGSHHLTPDHACGLAEFWGLDDVEFEHFMTLVELARASGAKLRKRLLAKLEDLQTSKLDLSKKLRGEKILDLEKQMLYYSS